MKMKGRIEMVRLQLGGEVVSCIPFCLCLVFQRHVCGMSHSIKRVARGRFEEFRNGG